MDSHGVYARNDVVVKIYEDDNTLCEVLPGDNVTRLKYDNPILFDLSMISSGVVTDRRNLINQQVVGCYGYVNPNCARQVSSMLGSTVFVSKRIDLSCLVSLKVTFCSLSLYHLLIGNTATGKCERIKVTKLAMQCVKNDPQKCPTMKQVVKYLGNLHAVQLHASNFAIDQALPVLIYNAKQQPDQYSGKGSSGQDHNLLQVFSYEELSMFTKGFDEENFIDDFQFGRVFRGRIEGSPVTVKVWEFQCWYKVEPGHNEGRLMDEIVLLQHAKLVSHPNLVKLIGYCYEGENLGVIYDLNPLDTVYNLVAKVRNISASHIMLDQDFNPKLFDFGTFSGGILPYRGHEKYPCVHGCNGYMEDLYYEMPGLEEDDVFAYGLVHLNLISKRFCSEVDIITNDMPLDFNPYGN
ncbi:unnamed protein product [Dovyalis caffra]|uniref:Protein kinase domain-containing protein n=1 Tax=Dovyalis caffra TaxID=77055 RepID=A0AAV1QQN5_9ROSI|nr:unnamed protein product [Dovyalis caffra]